MVRRVVIHIMVFDVLLALIVSGYEVASYLAQSTPDMSKPRLAPFARSSGSKHIEEEYQPTGGMGAHCAH